MTTASTVAVGTAAAATAPTPSQSLARARQAMILTAGLGSRIQVVTRGAPKVTVTSGGTPALVTHVKQLRSCGVRDIIIVHGPGAEQYLRSLIEQVFGEAGMHFTMVCQQTPSGPLDALRVGAKAIRRDGDLTVVLGDTLVAGLESMPEDSVGLASVDQAHDFCLAQVDTEGRIWGFENKPARSGRSEHALVGVYRFADAALVHRLLTRVARPSEGEVSDLLCAYGRKRPMQVWRAGQWRDLGSYGRYVTANRLAITGRASHRFAAADDGSITKHGQVDLVSSQVSWYRKLPRHAMGLTPRLLDWGETWYRTELLDYPSLAQLLLFEPLPEETWQLLLHRLMGVMEEFLWAPTRRLETDLAQWCESVYVDKTLRRLAAWERWAAVRSRQVSVNGRVLPSFDQLWPAARNMLLLTSAAATRGSLIHADMTFSNVLLSRGYGTFKLIDPGTAFSNRTVGDTRYDLAKLRQSYAGGYDVFREELFELRQTAECEWRLRTFPIPDRLATVGDSVLTKLGHDVRAIRLLEATQFLSMVPLHYESPDRQLALYFRGLESLTTLVHEGRTL